jgi:pyruvate formate lyase activating enzyme
MTNGVPITVERAKTEVAKYRHGLRMMKGGFTVSGGEPLMQDRFVIKLFTAAQAMGIHTALDSNGYLGSRLTDEDLEKIDLVLLDIKAWDRERHHQLTGMDIAPVLDFARRLAILRKPIWLRYVLVAGLTDDAEDIAQIANFVAGPGNVERVDVLPFHQLGAFKWKQLGIEYKLLDAEPPQKAIVERACTQFQAVGLKAY